MPITKTDIQNFGKSIKDFLTVTGEQIQYGRDIATLKKIQSRLGNIKTLTTNPDGTSKSREDIARTLFSVQTDIESNIRTPGIMQLANQTVGQFISEALKSAQIKEQNKLEQGLTGAFMPPERRDIINNIVNPLERTLYDYPYKASSMNLMRPFSPHYRTIIDPEDDKYEVDLEVMYLPDEYGKFNSQERVIGRRLRTSETPKEKYAREIDVRKTPTRSSVFSSSINLTPSDRSFMDENGKPINVILKNGKYYDPDTGKQVKVQNLTPMTENVNPNAGKTKDMSGYQMQDHIMKQLGTMLDKGTMADVKDYISGVIDDSNDIIQKLKQGNPDFYGLIYDLKHNANNEYYLSKYLNK